MAAEIVGALRGIPGGTVVADRFRSNEVMSPEVISAIEGVVHLPTFRAAGWAEVARLSALRGERPDVAGLRDSIVRIGNNESLSREARLLARQISKVLQADSGLESLPNLAARLMTALAKQQ